MPDILVVKPSSFGDIVHGLQVAETIRQRVRDVRIAWIAAGAFAPIVRACRTVDEVFVFERRAGLAGFFRLMRAVRRRRFDVVLDMQGLARSGLMTWRARGDRKIGRADAREGAGLFCPETIPLPAGGRNAHAVDILLQFLTAFEAAPEIAGRLEFAAPSADAPEMALPAGSGPLLVMFPGSRRPEKNWPGFRALTGQLLVRQADVRIVWAGHEPVAELPANADGRFVNLLGRTRIDQLPALVAAADWVIANDSGPMHLAAALGVRVLAVFGPTDPRRFGPYPVGHPLHRVVSAPNGDLARLPAEHVAAVLIEAGLKRTTRM